MFLKQHLQSPLDFLQMGKILLGVIPINSLKHLNVIIKSTNVKH